jgi:hypothetical protein
MFVKQAWNCRQTRHCRDLLHDLQIVFRARRSGVQSCVDDSKQAVRQYGADNRQAAAAITAAVAASAFIRWDTS